MKSSDYKNIILLLILVILSRVVLLPSEQFHYSPDTVGFERACVEYNLENDAPHLPGYFLHILILKFISNFGYSYHSAMNFLSILYSVLSSVFLYFISRIKLEQSVSLLITILLMTIPMVWFYGIVGEIYVFDLMLGSAVLLLHLKGKILFSLPLLAISLGIRPSSPVLLLPFVAYSIYYSFKQKKIEIWHLFTIIPISIFLLLAWVLPFMGEIKNIDHYITLYKTHSPLPKISIIQNVIGFVAYMIYFLPFVLLPYLLGKLIKAKMNYNKKAVIDILLFTIPATIFFIVFHYSKGYILLIAPAMFYAIAHIELQKIWLYTVIFLQVTLFLLYPAQMPIPELKFAPNSRPLSNIQTQVLRLNSYYSHTYSFLKKSDFMQNDMYDFFDSLQGRGIIQDTTIVLFDPSIFANFNMIFHNINHERLAIINFNEVDSYYYKSKNHYKVEHGLESISKDAVCIGDKQFVEKYLVGLVDVISESQYHCYYKIKIEKKYFYILDKLYKK